MMMGINGPKIIGEFFRQRKFLYYALELFKLVFRPSFEV